MAVLEGARAALKVGAVSKGERVGFICDLRVEPDVIYAFFAAAGELGASPFLCMVDRGRGYGPPDEFVEAIKTANVLYFSWEMANSLVIKALRQERGIRCVGFPHCRTAALLSDATELAAALAKGPTFANGMTKRMLEMEWAMSVPAAIEAEAVAQALAMTTEDFRRAYDAFAAKRKPVFEGN